MRNMIAAMFLTSAAMALSSEKVSAQAPARLDYKTAMEIFEQEKADGKIIDGEVLIDSISSTGALLYSGDRMILMNRREQEEAKTVMNDGIPNNNFVRLDTKFLFPSSAIPGKKVFTRGQAPEPQQFTNPKRGVTWVRMRYDD